jgi:hypothetical protein
MKHLLSRLIICTLCFYISIPLRGDCNSCTIITNTTGCCSKNKCIKFKNKTKALCAIIAQELEATNAYINNATLQNLRVFNNEQINGTLNVNGQAIVLEDLNINGSLTLNGSSTIATGFSQYAFFTRNTDQAAIDDGEIVEFTTNAIAPTSGISNANGVITFAESGLYLINFTTQIEEATGNNAFRLISDPNGTATPITGAAFAVNSTPLSEAPGMTLVQITAGQQIALANYSGTTLTLTTTPMALVEPANVAAISIIKLN